MPNQPSKISDWEKEFDNLPLTNLTTKEFIKNLLIQQRTEILEEVANDIQKIIEKGKATFFVNKDNKDIIIPTDEALYELKATISDNIGIYFYEKLNQLKNKEK